MILSTYVVLPTQSGYKRLKRQPRHHLSPMAATTPSPLTSSSDKTNGAKLSRLLIDGGTTVLRNVFDRYHPPANLAADLNANLSTLKKLLKKKVLRTAQWD